MCHFEIRCTRRVRCQSVANKRAFQADLVLRIVAFALQELSSAPELAIASSWSDTMAFVKVSIVVLLNHTTMLCLP